MLLAGAIVYSLSGFLVAPLLLERRLESVALQDPSSRVTIERVSVNPYTFRIVLTQTTLHAADGRRLVSVPRIEARLDAASLLKGDPVVRNLTIEQPAFLFAPPDQSASTRSPLNAGLAFLTTDARALALARVERLALRGGSFRLGPSGASLDDPSMTAAPRAADFDLEIRHPDAIDPGDALFHVKATMPRSATLEGEGTLQVTDEGVRLDGDFELNDTEIEALSAGDAVFKTRRIDARGVRIDTAMDTSSVELLRLEQPQLRLVRLQSGRIDLPEWLVHLATGSDSAIAAVDRIEVSDASSTVVDRKARPEMRVQINAIDGEVLPRATGRAIVQSGGQPRSLMTIRLQGRLPGAGVDRMAASWQPSDRHAPGHLELELTDVDLALLSPYFRAMTGRGLDSGRLDLTLRTVRAEEEVRSEARFTVRRLEFGDCDGEFSRRRWPLERAVALLEDNDGRIELSLAGRTKASIADSYRFYGLGTALRDRIAELAARPFEAMAELAGQPEQPLDHLPFEPGSAAITAIAQTRLNALGAALATRPALALRILPAYDPRSDRRALAEQQMRLHIGLATSTGPPGRVQRAPLDFDNRKVRVVLDEFAAERLSQSALKSVSARYPTADRSYYKTVFGLLVDNEAVSTSALERLAGYRAQSVADGLAAAGIARARLSRAEVIEQVDGRPDAVSVTFEVSANDDCSEAARVL